MPFDIEGARKAGYSDAEIIQHLNQSNAFKIEEAKKAGYTEKEIADHLAGLTGAKTGAQATAPQTPQPAAPGDWLGALANVGRAINRGLTWVDTMGGTMPKNVPMMGPSDPTAYNPIPTPREGAVEAGALAASLAARPLAQRLRLGPGATNAIAAGARTGIGAAAGALENPDDPGNAALAHGAVTGAVESIPYGGAAAMGAKVRIGRALSTYLSARGLDARTGQVRPQLTVKTPFETTGGGSVYDTKTGQSIEVPRQIHDVEFNTPGGKVVQKAPTRLHGGDPGDALWHQDATGPVAPKPPRSGNYVSVAGAGVRRLLQSVAGNRGEGMPDLSGQQEEQPQAAAPAPQGQTTELNALRQWKATKFGKGMQDPNYEAFAADMKAKGAKQEDITDAWYRLNSGKPTNVELK